MRNVRLIITLACFSLTGLTSLAPQAGGQPARGRAAVPEAAALWEHILLLEEMVSLWPKQEYYLQLADLYGRAGDSQRELRTYEIAYGMGWLDRTGQFVRFAQLLLRAGRLAEADDALRHALDLVAAEIPEGP
jgi:tetratricopeptide (TPR) repeat protein